LLIDTAANERGGKDDAVTGGYNPVGLPRSGYQAWGYHASFTVYYVKKLRGGTPAAPSSKKAYLKQSLSRLSVQLRFLNKSNALIIRGKNSLLFSKRVI